MNRNDETNTIAVSDPVSRADGALGDQSPPGSAHHTSMTPTPEPEPVASESSESADRSSAAVGVAPTPATNVGGVRVAGAGREPAAAAPNRVPRRRVASGGDNGVPVPPTGDGEAAEWANWLYENNPLYLMSVLFMFLGLFLVSKASYSLEGGATYTTVVGFFAIQNIYELIMVGMALYLFLNRVNNRHGKILLVFVMLFVSDLSFYLARISTMEAGKTAAISPAMIAGIYWSMAALKVAAVVYFLDIRIRIERLIYPLCALALIYFAPQYIYQLVDAIKSDSAKNTALATQGFTGYYELYVIWFVAALIQLPVIIGSWRRNDLDSARAHRFLGDENAFYRFLLMFPFIVLPLQIVLNNEPDIRAKILQMQDTSYNYIPYLICGIFFMQQFCRRQIEESIGLNTYDFAMLMVVFMLALSTRANAAVNQNFNITPWTIHQAMIIIAHIACFVTRGNLYCAGFLAFFACYHMWTWLCAMAQRSVEEMRTWSSLTWAQILMAGSFLLLGLGFAVSVKGRRKQLPHSTNE